MGTDLQFQSIAIMAGNIAAHRQAVLEKELKVLYPDPQAEEVQRLGYGIGCLKL